MRGRSLKALTPRETIEGECARRGRMGVIDGCIRLVAGDYGDEEFAVALGGVAALPILDGSKPVGDRYWLRVWGARGLLWCWDDRAFDTIRGALTDPAWRVREMAAKVIARHVLADLSAEVARLREDPVPRVSAAAARALAVITAACA